MTAEENIFANALTIEDLEAKFKTTIADVLSFFLETGCLDSSPPMPKGGK